MEDFRVITEARGKNVQITGVIGHTVVISVSNSICGKWMAGTSSCLPVNITQAKAYIDCMVAVMEKARELGANVD